MNGEKNLKICRGCGTELEVGGYYPSRAKRNDWLCPKCCQEGNKQYMLNRRIQEYLGTRVMNDDAEVTSDDAEVTSDQS